MSVFFVRASTVTLLFCAACSSGTDPTTSSSSSSTGSGGSSSTSTSTTSSTSGSGGSTPAMECELTITNIDANIDITSYGASHAQGAEKHVEGEAIAYVFAAADSSHKGVTELLNIGVSGPMLTQGMTYSLDEKSSILLLTIIDTTAVEKDWKAAPGAKMTVDLIKPGVVTGYRSVTFGLTDVLLEADAELGAGNKATGTFKMSGECTGAVLDYQGP